MIEEIKQALKQSEIEVTVSRRFKILDWIFGDKAYKIKPPTLMMLVEIAEVVDKFKVKGTNEDADDEVIKVIINNKNQFAEYISLLLTGKKSKKKGIKIMRRLSVVELEDILNATIKKLGISNFATSIVIIRETSQIKATEIIAEARKTSTLGKQ